MCISCILEQIYANGETTIVPEQEKLQLHGKNTNENLDDKAECNVEKSIKVKSKYIHTYVHTYVEYIYMT